MPYSHLLGNEPIKVALQKMVEKQTVPHAMLFAGPEGVGKSLFAHALAAELIGKRFSLQHPDLHLYLPEGKGELHPIDQIRACIQEMEMPPFEAPVKVFIIEKADQMWPASSNALLKTLEEPPPNTHLILITDRLSQILPTIASRCCKYLFSPVAQEDIATYLKSQNTANASEIAAEAQGSFAKALQILNRSTSPWYNLLHTLLSYQLHNYPELLKGCSLLEEAIDDSPSPTRTFDAILEEILRSSKSSTSETLFLQIEKARLAFARNVKPRVLLEWLLTRPL